ncbi:hypothetical protein BN14_09522 [Rhizoctonia solani AG-1 IB]|uniref:Uncharacterized protein n=1 Tax=Thanatephorus cucumeris (strain AG1-IB / isolate 7/3/14) TaxID=1108050 RepID=M5C7T8_THACB|nr:hypothetical protein BN14_09522 [Rhizoctonia solani AG-1 IB]
MGVDATSISIRTVAATSGAIQEPHSQSVIQRVHLYLTKTLYQLAEKFVHHAVRLTAAAAYIDSTTYLTIVAVSVAPAAAAIPHTTAAVSTAIVSAFTADVSTTASNTIDTDTVSVAAVASNRMFIISAAVSVPFVSVYTAAATVACSLTNTVMFNKSTTALCWPY